MTSLCVQLPRLCSNILWCSLAIYGSLHCLIGLSLADFTKTGFVSSVELSSSLAVVDEHVY